MPPPPLLPPARGDAEDNALAAAVRKLMPAGLADKCRIQVIVQMPEVGRADDAPPSDDPPAHAPEHREECHSNSSP